MSWVSLRLFLKKTYYERNQELMLEHLHSCRDALEVVEQEFLLQLPFYHSFMNKETVNDASEVA